ncbi:cobalamin B12-binding domain-containing protein [Intestinibacter bartlettii]|uniref:B12 binding domain protein n=2 Tax=Intestinibacter bartlettii TaxID=261299 RepID=R5XLT0_9FIRM|nr:cobalamin-dependent protein [Intestinibacter bartlettii]MCB5397851.1 cobalamin-dependent protein [Intestinibacter bartlettii]MCB5404344.1 cobalamin-dependent protein [Intestinibacter bartlettii]MCB5446751.1 cobalamin-dependent protein [Intestinibacter bartlettii]MCB5721235.1 cobalamin-dependent protein [Intestinibacter bartlettii]MCB5749479.1 cobalamin-dependent protein [Intestinibacter bartlettii]
MDVYERVRQNILEGEAEEVSKIVKELVNLKYPPEKILQEGLIKGIEILADKFKTEMVLIPEALVATRALNAGLKTISPYIKKDNMYKARAVIGTVEGDIHDIGKNLVKMVVSTVGVEVIDLGIDVSIEKFIDAIKKYKPQLVMISALLTTTLKQMKLIIEEIENKNLRDDVIIFVGGAPVTRAYAMEIKADYYTKDVVELRDLLDENLDKILKQKSTKKSR